MSSSSAASAAAASSNPSVFNAAEQALAGKYLSFVNSSPSQFHAVATTVAKLVAAGFQQVCEKDAQWNVKAGGKYFYTRNQSSVVSFAVGEKWVPGNGFTITAAHTDSPVLKLKPVSKVAKNGYLQVGVECYGGGLWHTWFDRDLSVAGRVIVSTADGGFESRLVHIARPILRIPTLAIHLNREVNDKGFIFNKQNHLLPIIATAVAAQLGAKSPAPATAAKDEAKVATPPFADLHHSVLVQLVAAELGVDVASIRDFELCLCDTQPAALGGVYNEFIFSRALDNLMMSFICTEALIASSTPNDLKDEAMIRIVGLFDHEECGSASIMGAASNNMFQLLNKLNADPSSYDAAIARSYLVSADMAHALHANYAELHEENHRPAMHKGLVIKSNANQRYATSGLSGFLLEEIARQNNVPVQKFVVRNDSMCGSTIGPILATSCGIRTVDVGVPQLSMHSIREMCGVADVHSAFVLLGAFYREFAAMDKRLVIKGE